MKIVFLDTATLGDVSLEPIAKLGELVNYANSTPQEALQRVGDCEVLMVNKVKVDVALLDAAAPKLKLICIAATGMNNIDLDAASRHGVIVRNVAGYSTDSVAQTTWMHILSLAGLGLHFDNVVKSGIYSRSLIFTDVTRSYTELAGKRIGIVGLGAIGGKVASIAEAFGMKVCYFSTSGTNHCDRYPSVSLDELMRESDVISVHAPLNDRTLGLIRYEQLAMMKPSAYIVNLGRGGIIDEADLARIIDEDRIAGAALDVFVTEPLPSDSPLLHTSHPEKLLFSPHTGWASIEARTRLVKSMADNVRKGW